MSSFEAVVRALNANGIRFVVTGVFGANYYTAGSLFVTQDQDLFLPLDASNLLRAWRCCDRLGLDLDANGEPLDSPRDLMLADSVVQTRALTTARDHQLLCVDLSLVMTGFTYDAVFQRSQVFRVGGDPVRVASLRDIVAAKAAANRPKVRLFFATHAAELRRLLGQQP